MKKVRLYTFYICGEVCIYWVYLFTTHAFYTIDTYIRKADQKMKVSKREVEISIRVFSLPEEFLKYVQGVEPKLIPPIVVEGGVKFGFRTLYVYYITCSKN